MAARPTYEWVRELALDWTEHNPTLRGSRPCCAVVGWGVVLRADPLRADRNNHDSREGAMSWRNMLVGYLDNLPREVSTGWANCLWGYKPKRGAQWTDK